MRTLQVRAYIDQEARWPSGGRVILAQYDAASIVVYQAFGARIAEYAVANQRFGGEFGLDRMSWIKTNFMWMMYRSSWGTSPGQEHVLAIWLQREAFDRILDKAVHSTFVPAVYESREAWTQAVDTSDVRLQWDPDHAPGGSKLARRAIQLGLRGDTLRSYAHDWILEIQDISETVGELAKFKDEPDLLLTPVEKPYPIAGESVARKIGADG